MSIVEKLNSIKDTVPHYWPIGSFIHHNPLKGFEDLHFKDALKKAQSIFGGKVYMDSSYFMELYKEGKIDNVIFESNIEKVILEKNLDVPLQLAKSFLMEVSPKWNSLRIKFLYKKEQIDSELYLYLREKSNYNDDKAWLSQLTRHMTLYEINDAIFGSNNKESIEKDIIEFVSRFLDENQTTLGMPNRDLGMFETFKLYENFEYEKNAESFVE